MAAEIRVDTIKGRSGINTFSFKGDGFSFDQKVGIGTTLASDPVKVTNAGKIAVGVVTCHTLFTKTINSGTASTISSNGNATFSGIVTATQFQGGGVGVGIKTTGGVIGYGFTTLNFIGTGNTFATSGNTVDISIAGGGGAGGESVVSDTNDLIVSVNNQQEITSNVVLESTDDDTFMTKGKSLVISTGGSVEIGNGEVMIINLFDI